MTNSQIVGSLNVSYHHLPYRTLPLRMEDSSRHQWAPPGDTAGTWAPVAGLLLAGMRQHAGTFSWCASSPLDCARGHSCTTLTSALHTSHSFTQQAGGGRPAGQAHGCHTLQDAVATRIQPASRQQHTRARHVPRSCHRLPLTPARPLTLPGEQCERSLLYVACDEHLGDVRARRAAGRALLTRHRRRRPLAAISRGALAT